MNTWTFLVGQFFFPKLVMDGRMKELRTRVNWLNFVLGLLLVAGVVNTILYVSNRPMRAPMIVKAAGK